MRNNREEKPLNLTRQGSIGSSEHLSCEKRPVMAVKKNKEEEEEASKQDNSGLCRGGGQQREGILKIIIIRDPYRRQNYTFGSLIMLFVKEKLVKLVDLKTEYVQLRCDSFIAVIIH